MGHRKTQMGRVASMAPQIKRGECSFNAIQVIRKL